MVEYKQNKQLQLILKQCGMYDILYKKNKRKLKSKRKLCLLKMINLHGSRSTWPLTLVTWPGLTYVHCCDTSISQTSTFWCENWISYGKIWNDINSRTKTKILLSSRFDHNYWSNLWNVSFCNHPHFFHKDDNIFSDISWIFRSICQILPHYKYYLSSIYTTLLLDTTIFHIGGNHIQTDIMLCKKYVIYKVMFSSSSSSH